MYVRAAMQWVWSPRAQQWHRIRWGRVPDAVDEVRTCCASKGTVRRIQYPRQWQRDSRGNAVP